MFVYRRACNLSSFLIAFSAKTTTHGYSLCISPLLTDYVNTVKQLELNNNNLC